MTDFRYLADQIDRLVAEAPPEQMPDLIGTLQATCARAWVRLTTAGLARRPDKRPAHAEAETLLTPEEAAGIARMAVRRLHRLTRRLPFRRRLSRKTILYEEAGFRAWLAARH